MQEGNTITQEFENIYERIPPGIRDQENAEFHLYTMTRDIDDSYLHGFLGGRMFCVRPNDIHPTAHHKLLISWVSKMVGGVIQIHINIP